MTENGNIANVENLQKNWNGRTNARQTKGKIPLGFFSLETTTLPTLPTLPQSVKFP